MQYIVNMNIPGENTKNCLDIVNLNTPRENTKNYHYIVNLNTPGKILKIAKI